MNYGEIKNCDIANGMGVRVSLFVSGCTNGCEGCFQPETWDFSYGEPFTDEVADSLIEMLRPGYIDGLTILGGEPFEPKNQIVLVDLMRRIRSELPGKNIWIFTGFTYEDILKEGTYCHTEDAVDMIAMADVLVDGRFELSKKNITLMFRGSENQRIIDLNKTRECGNLVLWNEAQATTHKRSNE